MRNVVVQCESIMRCGDGAQQPSGPHVSHADRGGFKTGAVNTNKTGAMTASAAPC